MQGARLNSKNKPFTTSATLGALALLLTLGGCITIQAPLHEETRTLDAAYADGMGLNVLTSNGAIAVSKADVDTVQITARIKATTLDRLEATRIVMDHDADGALVVYAQWPGGKRRSREGTSFEILTPGADGVQLTSSNGSLTIEGLQGDAVLHTSNGRITATDHAGDAQAVTSNGAVVFERVTGSITARTSNGRIRLLDVDGEIDASTSNGGVVVRLAEGAGGPVHISTSNGGVKLVLSKAFRGELELHTSNGGISYETPATVTKVTASKHHAVLRFSQDGPTSIVSTSNGAIHVEFSDDDE